MGWNWPRLVRALSGVVLLFVLADCGDGGGGPPAIIVSGRVQAPGGQIAFFRERGLLERLASLLVTEVHAAVSGLSSVPDGTLVELGRISAAGAIARIATSTTTGGRYSFDLSNLGLVLSSDLAVRVIDTNRGVQMRAFVSGATVDIDPISESAIRMVLDQIASSTGTVLSDFTPQELHDLVGSLDLLTRTKQSAAGLDIESSVATIRQVAAADAGLMAFVAAAAATGETTEGPGDIGNYQPLSQGNTWRFHGSKSAPIAPILYFNTLKVTGTQAVGGLNATVFFESNPDPQTGDPYAPTQGSADFLVKDSRGVTNYGTSDPTDSLTPQVVPFKNLRFPLQAGDSFESLNKKGVHFGDLDSDGKDDIGDVLAQVTVVGFESVTVPAGTFANVVRVETKITITVTASSSGASATVTATQTEWLAPGVGRIKIQIQPDTQSSDGITAEELLGYFIDGQGEGIVSLTVASPQAGEFFYGRHSLATDGTSYLLVSCRTSGSSPGIVGVFVSGAGAGEPFLISPGNCPFAEVSNVAFDGTNYLVVFAKSEQAIQGIRVTPSGTVLDGPDGFAIASGPIVNVFVMSPSIAFDGTNYLVVWYKRTAVVNTMANNDIVGATVAPAGQVSAEIPISVEQDGLDNTLGAPSLVFDGTNYLVVWNRVSAGAGSSVTSDISAARVTPGGVVLDPQGILVSTSGLLSGARSLENVHVAFDGTNYLVVWRKFLSSGIIPPIAEVHGARISQAGALLDGPASGQGFAINTFQEGKGEPVVVFDGSKFLVAWGGGSFFSDSAMYGARISPAGQVVEGAPTTLGVLLNNTGFADLPAVCTNGTTVMLTWLNTLTTAGQRNPIEASLIFP